MSTTPRTRPAPPASTDDEVRTPGRFEAPGSVRLRPRSSRIRPPWIVLGVLLVVGSGLVFAVWADGAESRSAVLALARDLPAGHTLTADDLTTVGVGSDATLTVVGPDALDDHVGRTLLVDLAAGSLLTGDGLTDGSVVDTGRALVAVTIPAEAVPAAGLGAGEAVMVVETPGSEITLEGDAAPLPRVWPATVFTASTFEAFDGLTTTVVSLQVDPFSAAEIAAAAATDRVRLVAVASVDDIPPELLLGDAVDPALLTAPPPPPDGGPPPAEEDR